MLVPLWETLMSRGTRESNPGMARLMDEFEEVFGEDAREYATDTRVSPPELSKTLYLGRLQDYVKACGLPHEAGRIGNFLANWM